MDIKLNMFKFTKHKGIILPINIPNIDTDIIIPKQFLKTINKLGLGQYLFHDWRFLDQKQLQINPNFILNMEQYKNASILLTRENFGCGSSREHAVWALLDYGFKVIIAPSFADIFYNNSFNNKLLLITLSDKKITMIFDFIKNSVVHCIIDLLDNKIIIKNKEFIFKIDQYRRFCLLNNLDDIDFTMKFMKNILSYEKNIPNFIANSTI